jgi:uncharacterized alpha-E superfamily protein
VAELLILRRDMPRSLHASMHELMDNLRQVGHQEMSEPAQCRPVAGPAAIWGALRNGHRLACLSDLRPDRVNLLGGRISRDFLAPELV